MAWKLKISETLHCPKHPRYSPERDGPMAVRGGCLLCSEMMAAWREATRLTGRLRDIRNAIDEAEMKKKMGLPSAAYAKQGYVGQRGETA